jgi:hypothetical protein
VTPRQAAGLRSRSMARPDAGSADTAAYAAIVARLAHRFADRAGVLDVRGLDEDRFHHLEQEVLGRVQRAAAGGDDGPLAALGRALLEARVELLSQEDDDPPEPLTVAAPTTGSETGRGDELAESAARAAGLDDAASSSGPTQVTAPPQHDAAVDVLDLMETLHSKGPGRPP